MQIYTVFIAVVLFKWTSAIIPEEPCKLDPWTGGKITNPAAKLRLNPGGIDLVGSLSTDNVTDVLKMLRLPDLQILDLTIYGTRVSDFQPPNYYRKLVRPNTIRWGFNQGQLAISGGFKQVIRALPIPGLSMDQQTIEANITIASGSTSLDTVSSMIRNGENRPTLSSSCTASLGILNVTITGNTVLTTVSEMIQRMVIDQIQRTFQQMLCASTNSIIKDNINKALKTFPSKSKLDGKNLILDYGLTENPKVVNNDTAVEAVLKGAVYYRIPSVYPFYPPAITETGNSQYMLDFFMTDYVLNTLLFTTFKEKLLKFEVTQKTMSSSSSKHLALSCPGAVNGNTCVGKIFPKASSIGGPDSYVKASIQAAESPKATFVDNDAYWTGRTMLKLEVVDSKNKTTKLFTANSTCMYGALTPKIYKSTLYAVINITNIPLTSIDSPTKDLDENDIKKLGTIFAAVFEEILNGILSIGFPLPLVDGVTLVNPSVQLLNRTLYVGSNFTYSEPTGFKKP